MKEYQFLPKLHRTTYTGTREHTRTKHTLTIRSNKQLKKIYASSHLFFHLLPEECCCCRTPFSLGDGDCDGDGGGGGGGSGDGDGDDALLEKSFLGEKQSAESRVPMDRPTNERPRIWDGRMGCMGDAIVGQTLLEALVNSRLHAL